MKNRIIAESGMRQRGAAAAATETTISLVLDVEMRAEDLAKRTQQLCNSLHGIADTASKKDVAAPIGLNGPLNVCAADLAQADLAISSIVEYLGIKA